MNYRVQLSPLFGTQEPRQDLPLCEGWQSQTTKWEDAEIFRSWLVYEADLEARSTPGRVHWNMMLGLALAVVVSVTFWIGVGLTIANRWK